MCHAYSLGSERVEDAIEMVRIASGLDEDEFKKASSHRAMDDIKESVNELKFYREKLFIKND